MVKFESLSCYIKEVKFEINRNNLKFSYSKSIKNFLKMYC